MAKSASKSAPQPTVLVVDDDSAVNKLCVAMLKQGGFNALAADGSSEALKICKEHKGKIDLLLTDLVMPPPAFQLADAGNEFPHVHGHELAVRASHLREGLKVLMMSGNPDQELSGYGIKRGNLPFVEKPFSIETLMQSVRNTLQGPPPDLSQCAPKSAGKDVPWFD